MAIPAGSKGGYFPPLRDTELDIASFVSKLPELYALYGLNRVRTVGLYVNNTCNLHCTHCYYQTPSGYRADNELEDTALFRAIDCGLKTGVNLFAFVGKEVFLPGGGAEKAVSAMKHIAASRASGSTVRMGAVTNGVFLQEYVEELSGVGLDYLDVSVEASEATINDGLRGTSSYVLAMGGLSSAVAAKAAKKIFVASTLSKANVASLPDLDHFCGNYGVTHFCITPVAATPDSDLYLSSNALLQFIGCLPAKLSKFSSGAQLIIDLDSYVVFSNLKEFSAIFTGSTVEIDALNNILLRTLINNVDLTVRISLPDPCNSYGCITHDGLYFDKSGCLFMKPGYEVHAAGDVRRVPLDRLIRTQEQLAHNLPDMHGPEVFQQPSHHVLKTIEGNSFYWEAEIA